MEKSRDQQTGTEKTRIVEQINICLHSGDYARALDLLRGTAAEFPNDAELSKLEKLAQDGVKCKAEADRLITESQDLFAQRKSAEAIQLLRKAYELDKNNSLARAILANALVEHAQSLVETDWLKAETLTNQALALNRAHPTAKTILSLIVDKKKTSSAEDWVSQARRLQSSGDLFAAMAWVAEGLAVHPNDPQLLQLQDAIQRDQGLRRRQARRGDLDDLRRLQREIDGAADLAAKQALAARIQTVAAKYWTDGEILSIANALLLRLGLVPQESSSASPRGKGATVILHVPRPSAPKPSSADISPVLPPPVPPGQVLPSQVPSSPRPVSPSQVAPSQVPSPVLPREVRSSPSPVLPSAALASPNPPSQASASPSLVPPSQVLPSQILPSEVPAGPVSPSPVGPSPAAHTPVSGKNIRTPLGRRKKVARSGVLPGEVPAILPELQLPPLPAATAAAAPSAPAAKVTSRSLQRKQPTKSNSTTLILISSSAATIILFAAIFFFARKHQARPVAQTPAAVPTVSAPTAPAPTASVPTASFPAASAPAETTPEPSLPAVSPSADTGGGKVTLDDQPPTESGHNLGTLVVVAGQDDARVFLNGKLQRQLTRAGQLRIPNLELKNYVVQVSKSGFQDPPRQEIRIRKGEEARLVFHLQPQPRLASLTIQGGAPGTRVFVDQIQLGTIPPDGTLSVSTVSPGDHTVELRKERFNPRQFKKHFVAGETIGLAAADAALEATPGELKITFSPADAKVALVKGELLKMVNSGVPLNLAAGTYTLTARTAERFTRSATLEVIAGQSRTLDLSLAPSGMSKWDDPAAWKPEGDSFIRKGGDFVLYGVVPASGTFVFSAMPTRSHLLQWVLNYTDPRNYILFQIDDSNFYRTVIRNGEKTDEIKVPHKGDKKSFRTLQISVSPTELVHQIKHGDSWPVLDRWTQPGTNLSLGKFGFYIPGSDQVVLSRFAHYADLSIR